jgi:hypothetical protein
MRWRPAAGFGDPLALEARHGDGAAALRAQTLARDLRELRVQRVHRHDQGHLLSHYSGSRSTVRVVFSATASRVALDSASSPTVTSRLIGTLMKIARP